MGRQKELNPTTEVKFLRKRRSAPGIFNLETAVDGNRLKLPTTELFPDPPTGSDRQRLNRQGR